MMATMLIDGFTLTAEQVVSVARTPDVKVGLAQSAREALKESRDYIEQTWMHDEAPMMYSFNTGVGLLKDTRIKVQDIVLFQTQMIKVPGRSQPRHHVVARKCVCQQLFGGAG
jgi:histidine ammonia-lyase